MSQAVRTGSSGKKNGCDLFNELNVAFVSRSQGGKVVKALQRLSEIVTERWHEGGYFREIVEFGLKFNPTYPILATRFADGKPTGEPNIDVPGSMIRSEIEWLSWVLSPQFEEEYHELRDKILTARRFSPEGFRAMLEVIMTDENGARWKLANHQREWADLLFEYPKLVILSPTESSKSETITIGWTLFRIGHNPLIRCGIASNSMDQAIRFTDVIARHITGNWWYKVIFPHIRPSTRGAGGKVKGKFTSKTMFVDRPVIMKDASIAAYSVGGAMLNVRLDIIILDDIVDHEIAASTKMLSYVNKWVESTVMSRLVKDGQFIAVGTAWHPNDVYHFLGQKKTFHFERYSVWPGDADLGYRIINWDRYPPERMMNDLEDLGEYEFNRQKRCRPYSDEDKLFPPEVVKMTEADPDEVLKTADKLPTYVGVDISASSRKGCAIVVVAVAPDRTRYVLFAEAGAWSGPKLRDKLIEIYDVFKPQKVVVENNATQGMIMEFLAEKRSDIPVVPFQTGTNKADPQTGLPSLSIEMQNGLWQIPRFKKHGFGCKCGFCQLYRELKSYPESSSDLLMALWFAREGARDKSLGLKKRKNARRIYMPKGMFKVSWI